jgi:hypothetical protein
VRVGAVAEIAPAGSSKCKQNLRNVFSSRSAFVINRKMANPGLSKVTHIEPDYKSLLGREDMVTKCIELLTKPNALLEFYLDLSKTQLLCEPLVRAFALLLLPRLKLDLPFNSKYLDRFFEDTLINSSLVNTTFEFLPPGLKQLFEGRNPRLFWLFSL